MSHHNFNFERWANTADPSPKLLHQPQENATVGEFDKRNARYLTCKAPWIVLNYILCLRCITSEARADTFKPMTSFLADAYNIDDACFQH